MAAALPPPRRWSPQKVTAFIVVGAATLLMFGIMRPDLMLMANTPTGGDMGAHVFLPAFVRDNLIGDGRILGWSNDWYAGFPVLYFYFPLPVLAIVALDVVMPYGVAFKLVTAAGVVALPAAAYYLVRAMGFVRPVATVAAVAGGSYAFMESHAIFGGNIKATMAGEFAFGWALALGLVYLGLVIKAVRTQRGFTPLAGVVLALTALSHIIVTLVVVVASLPLLMRRKASAPVLGSWAIGFAVAGFWALPLMMRIFGGYTTDMGWAPVEGFDKVIPREFIPIVILAVLGMAWSLQKGYDVVALVWFGVLPVIGYLLFPLTDFTKLYNARLLPFWYLAGYLFAGIAVGLVVVHVARRARDRRTALVVGSGLAALAFVVVALVGMAQIPGWVRWNYTGYEGKEPFAEYQGLMTAIDELPDGRVLWEANGDMNRYGTPMALMLTPYWTESSHPSMEGLYFESSITTPFHFLNAAEVSQKPSNPVRGLDYNNFNFERALDHLPVYDIRYYVSFTPEATEAASAMPEFTQLVTAEPWTVFELPESSLVDVATTVPVVYDGPDFVDAALAWYDRTDELDLWLVEDGPAAWPRMSDPEASLTGLGSPIAQAGEVSAVELENHRIAFDTTAVGVPHLVKVSDFPNWTAEGAEGPYRAAPSLMVVIPTEEHVEITFERTWDEQLGLALTAGGLLLAASWPLIQRRRHRSSRGKFAA